MENFLNVNFALLLYTSSYDIPLSDIIIHAKGMFKTTIKFLMDFSKGVTKMLIITIIIIMIKAFKNVGFVLLYIHGIVMSDTSDV